ncbi:hypothetical protein E8E11_007355 [Didymella keratinophila]|nr:hypothetical protein E8E11_007355 [Didymella keratinophila]
MAVTDEQIPNRQWDLIGVSIVMLVFSTAFTAMNIAAISVAIAYGFAGAGRLLRDPFWTLDEMIYQNHTIFASQLLNVYGMWLVKLFICAYLLALKFSKGYRWVIWGTVAFVTIFNFILLVIQHFGLCQPLASRWNTRIKDKQCWSPSVRISIAYTQAISNIVTDLIYATAPIAYLHSVQLSRRTQWSVRIVFLMFLLVYFQKLQGQAEVYYESVALSIWSITEISVGIVVANLPPLRKSFDGMFKQSLLDSVTDKFSSSKPSQGHGQSYGLPTYRSQVTRRSTIEAMTGRSARQTEDNESDKACWRI